MSLDLLATIREKEREADHTKAQAQTEARDMLKGVEIACSDHERAAALENRALYQRMLDERRREEERVLSEERKAREPSVAAYFDRARGRLDAAAARIVERVMKNGHC